VVEITTAKRILALASSPCPHLFAFTDAALSASTKAVSRIGGVVRVPLGAARFPIQAILILAASASNRAARVLLLSNRFKMVGIHAVPIQAQMINDKTSRNRADVEFVGESVDHSVFRLASGSCKPPDLHVAVPTSINTAPPSPASAYVLVGQAKQASFQRLWFWARRATTQAVAGGTAMIAWCKMKLHRKAPFGVVQPVVTRHAAAFIIAGAACQ